MPPTLAPGKICYVQIPALDIGRSGFGAMLGGAMAFRKFETTVLITQDELLKALQKAQDVAYVAPGTAVHA